MKTRTNPMVRFLGRVFDSPFSMLPLNVMAVVFGLVTLSLGLRWVTMGQAAKYAEKYHVSEESVMIQKKPANCDWSTAPLGNKNRHFVRHVDPIKDDRGRVTGVAVYWVKEED